MSDPSADGLPDRMNPATPLARGLVQRRTLAQGLAWTAPVAVLGASAPLAAASIPPGLQGWVTVRKSCRSNQSSITGEIDGTGTPKYPNGIYGLYVLNTNSTTTVSNASITFFLPTSFGTPTWSLVGSYQGWSTPVVNSTPSCPNGCPTGATAYVMYYADTWGWTQGTNYTIANGVPNFTANSTTGTSFCTNGLSITAVRCVTVNGSQICFQRSVSI